MKSKKRIDLKRIEGIGPAYDRKFKEQGIQTVEGFLEAAADRNGRQKLAGRLNVSDKLILEWTNLADLMRIKGIGEEYSQLLEAAGVDSPLELRNRRADTLYAKMIELNAVKKYVRRTPSLSQVISWIEEAKSLAQVVTH